MDGPQILVLAAHRQMLPRLLPRLLHRRSTQPMGWKKMPPAAAHGRPMQPVGQPAVPVSDDEEDDD